MPRCTHCGAHVSQRFATVFGDGDGEVRACPNCTAKDRIVKEIHARAGAT